MDWKFISGLFFYVMVIYSFIKEKTKKSEEKSWFWSKNICLIELKSIAKLFRVYTI